MQPTNFIQSNFTFTKPESMTEEECGSLQVYRGEMPNGTPVIISKWQPSEQDIEAIKNGEGIWLSITGTGMPPVSVFTENPFVPAPVTQN